MSATLSTFLRPVFRLSADAFPRLAAQRFGAQEDMDRTWRTFEPVARTLVDSFYLAIDNRRQDQLAAKLDAVDPELRGIAYEGAGMGVTLLDSLLPGSTRLPSFLAGPGAPYRCLVLIGAGLVLPRVPRRPERFLARQDPLLRWFVMDGYGFYEGFFSWRRTIEAHGVPRRLHGYARQAFDQGVGRSLWFSTGANVDRIISTINRFEPSRQPDLWSGIGVACAYAAGVMDRVAVSRLFEAAGRHRAHVAVGTAIASVFRAESGHAAPHTDLACEVVWRRDSLQVAAVAEETRLGLDTGPDAPPLYAQWRRRIEDRWLAGSQPSPDASSSTRRETPTPTYGGTDR
ncbi:DUF1702 family protein [Micromonospora sp. WMMA1998]|uniref:DUF1702 family protein n=1 Tax=Micromonospora sp. WMMA1998 TaxID=3015167 RepID=UPI00248AA84C|nr:DUF1702 family protein [Micromonospora sp. WMMA1998]WBC14943.1 DUF1702 family protein [Micromonospora sp. WMMA1998]